MKTIRVGSRESWLAVVQSELVMDAIRAAHPEVGLELVTMKTTGDKILDRTLDKVGGKGLFVKELDAALLDGRVDLTVHSCKDLPMEEDPRIPLAGFSRREDPGTCWYCPRGGGAGPSRPIGCALRPAGGAAAGAVSRRGGGPGAGQRAHPPAQAGRGAVLRLCAGRRRPQAAGAGGAHHPVLHGGGAAPRGGSGHFGPPDPGGEELSCLDGVLDADGTDCARAERAFVRTLDGGCSAPIAAHARLEGDTVTIDGLYVTDAGEVRRGRLSGPRAQGEDLGEALARRIKEGGTCLEK